MIPSVYLKAYTDLSDVIMSDNMSYHEYLLESQEVNIVEKLKSYISVVNNLKPDELRTIKLSHLKNMWRRCITYIPLVLRFPPSLTKHNTEKLIDYFGSYLAFEHTSDIVSEQKLKFDELREVLESIDVFSQKHSSFTHITPESTEVERILSCLATALDSIYETYEDDILYLKHNIK